MPDSDEGESDGDPEVRIRIGELARRTGVSPEALRAWERRYGLFRPDRTPGGFRLYQPLDARRARMMQDRVSGGVPAAEAARRTLADLPHAGRPQAGTRSPGSIGDPFAHLRAAIEAFDGAAAHEALDRLGKLMSIDSLLTHGVAPFLAEGSDIAEPSDLGDARMRFATPLLRGRLLERARGWHVGESGTALLACAPGQHADVGLICTGVALNARGWRVVFLGADVRLDSTSAAAEAVAPDVAVIDVRSEDLLVGLHEQVRALASTLTLYVSCEGMGPNAARALGARLLSVDPVRAARQISSDAG